MQEKLNVKQESLDELVKDKYKNILDNIKMDGKFQKIIFLHICMSAFISCLLLTVFPLQKDLPEYLCIDRQEFLDDNVYLKYRFDTSNRFKVIKNEHCIEKYCHKLENDFQSPILWHIVADYNSIKNFVTELDVFCDLEGFFGRLTQFVFSGRIFGMMLFSYIADKKGRYICFLIQVYIITISYIIFLFFKSKIVFLIIGFFASSCLNIYNLASIMSTEIMSQPMYSLLNGLIGACFTLCGIIDILVLYFIKDWNILLYIHLVVCAIVYYITKHYLTETPLFLLDRKEYDSLNSVICKISKINDTYEQQNVQEKIKNVKELINSKKQDYLTDEDMNWKNNLRKKESVIESIFGPYILILKSNKNLVQFIQLLFIYLAMNLVFYGQLLNIERMDGNIYFNSFIIYIAEIIAEVLAGYILQIMQRRRLIAFCFLLSSIFCGAIGFLEGDENLTYRTAAIFANSFCCSISFISVYVYSAELFDTNVKSTLISLLSNISNLFMLVSPYLIELFATPFALFAIFSFIASLNALILKETKQSDNPLH